MRLEENKSQLIKMREFLLTNNALIFLTMRQNHR